MAAADKLQDAEAIIAVQRASCWAVGAFAAVGTALLTGLQLSALGGLGVDQVARLVLAGAVMGIALVVVAVVIVKGTRVLTTPWASLDALVERELTARKLEAEAGVPAPSFADLAKRDPVLGRLYQSRDLVFPAQATTPHELANRLREARRAGSDTAPLERSVQRAVVVATREVVEERYRSLIRWLIRGGLVVAVGIVGFAWAAHPPESAAPARVTEPIAVEVHIRDSAAAVAVGLAEACVEQTLVAVAVDGELRAPEVVTGPRAGCPAARFVVTPELGIAVPITD